MESEVIFEAFGEVVPIDRKNGSKVSLDEGFEATDEDNFSNMQPLFNNDMTDDAVVERIFNSCDTEKTGFVRASILFDFLLKYDSENREIKEIFQDVLIALDPTDTNPEITIEKFQSALKFCINKMTVKTEDSWLLEINSLKPQSVWQQHSTSSINNESASSRSSSSLELQCMDVKELQYQYNRLQEENTLLQEQMADVEENNISLRSENSHLKNKINKVELTVSEIGQQSQMLQEDNGQLQGRVMQMKDDLQKMTLHYEECRKELQDKVNELENLQLNRLKGEERCKNLIDTIRHLEEIIQIKEEELETKDKEIQKIAQDLMEQQLLSDRVITNEFNRSKGQEVGETLAAELQSSFGDTPWKKQMGSVSKPDFIHPAAWNVMLNEPEYEDDPVNQSSSCEHSESPSRVIDNEIITNKTTQNNFGRTINWNSNALTTQISASQSDNMVHSTPISKTAPGSISWKAEQPFTKNSKLTGLLDITRHSLRILFLSIFMLTILFTVASVIALLLLMSLSTTTGFNGVSNYHQEASPYYSSSLWSKVFEILKPFCSIEYHGCPPV